MSWQPTANIKFAIHFNKLACFVATGFYISIRLVGPKIFRKEK